MLRSLDNVTVQVFPEAGRDFNRRGGQTPPLRMQICADLIDRLNSYSASYKKLLKMEKTTFTYKEIVELLGGADDENLYREAQNKKEEVYGKEVFLRAIVEPWNTCIHNCLYCGIRKDNRYLKRFLLNYEEIYEAGIKISDYGITSLVLQAGEDLNREKINLITKVVEAFKKDTNADITLSFGEHTIDTYKMWKDAGSDRYLLKMETLQENIYNLARPNCNFRNRIKCIEDLLNLGYQVGSGFIAGMPGYTIEMLAKDMLSLKDMGIHMFSLSPFINSKNTPWENFPRPDADLVHRACAIYRLLDPKVNIPVTSAMESLQPGSKKAGLLRGCNVLMHSLTPKSVREFYRIYDGKNVIGDEEYNQIKKIKEMVSDIGLYIKDGERGRSKK